MLDLTSVRAKLSRSQEHAQTLKNELRAWMDRHPYSLLQQPNPELTRFSAILRVNEPPLFQRWSLIYADALHTLRNALDHLVYAIASHESAPNPPAKEGRLRFPITDCRSNFDSEVAGNRLGTISDPIRTAIEASQPYNRPHHSLPPVLSILREYTNADKHRLIQVVYGTILLGNFGFVSKSGAPIIGNWEPFMYSGEIKDGTEIFAMVGDTPAPPDMHFDRTLVDVVLAIRHAKRSPSDPDWTERSDIIGLYGEIATEVRTIVYEVSAEVNRHEQRNG